MKNNRTGDKNHKSAGTGDAGTPFGTSVSRCEGEEKRADL